MNSEVALRIKNLSKTFGSYRANDGISFKVRRGTIHALVGENGAGKSTLMKLLFGMLEPDSFPDAESGIYLFEKKVSFRSPKEAISSKVGMVQQHFALVDSLSVLDNILLGKEPTHYGLLDRAAALQKLTQLAGSTMKLPWSRMAVELPVGFKQRLEILRLLYREAEVLLLDEPTAVLAPSEISLFFHLLEEMKVQGKTILLTTHKVPEIFAICDEVTVLRRGRVTLRAVISRLEPKTALKNPEKDRDEPSPISLNKNWDEPVLMTQLEPSFGPNLLVQAMVGKEIQPIIKPTVERGKPLLELSHVKTPGLKQGSLNGVTFILRENEILGIAGIEGNGQSALSQVLLGIVPSTGTILYQNQPLPKNVSKRRMKANFGFVPEDRHQEALWANGSVLENCAIGLEHHFFPFGILHRKKLLHQALSWLHQYQVHFSSLEQPVSSLSGGNQQKLILAREILGKSPKLLIANQPTRGIDVSSTEFIHKQLLFQKQQGSGILLISSDLAELCALSDRILVLSQGIIVGEFDGPLYDLSKIGAAMTESQDFSLGEPAL